MTELKAKGVCDFCGEACNADVRGAKAYDCAEFPMAMTGAMSHGAWGACPACAALVDGEKSDDLGKRHECDAAPPLWFSSRTGVAETAADARSAGSIVSPAPHRSSG